LALLLPLTCHGNAGDVDDSQQNVAVGENGGGGSDVDDVLLPLHTTAVLVLVGVPYAPHGIESLLVGDEEDHVVKKTLIGIDGVGTEADDVAAGNEMCGDDEDDDIQEQVDGVVGGIESGEEGMVGVDSVEAAGIGGCDALAVGGEHIGLEVVVRGLSNL
jgi:hypothetical protein